MSLDRFLFRPARNFWRRLSLDRADDWRDRVNRRTGTTRPFVERLEGREPPGDLLNLV